MIVVTRRCDVNIMLLYHVCTVVLEAKVKVALLWYLEDIFEVYTEKLWQLYPHQINKSTLLYSEMHKMIF